MMTYLWFNSRVPTTAFYSIVSVADIPHEMNPDTYGLRPA